MPNPIWAFQHRCIYRKKSELMYRTCRLELILRNKDARLYSNMYWLWTCGSFLCSSQTTSTYAGLPEQKAVYMHESSGSCSAVTLFTVFFNPPLRTGLIHCPVHWQRFAFGSFCHHCITILPEYLRTQHVSAQAITIMHACNGIFALHGPAALNTALRLPLRKAQLSSCLIPIST